MPELPEVEITRRSFAQRIGGARIAAVRLGAPLRWPLGIEPQALIGRSVQAVDRRGKYLILRLGGGLNAGADAGVLLIHLGMSGRLVFTDALPPPGPHDHFDLHTDQGLLRLRDPRRFGAVVWSPGVDADPARKLLAELGVEPLTDDFDPARFHQALRRRLGAIKQVLLAGHVVVGVGNIYASEALFEAGIRPDTPACRLSRRRADRLHAAIRAVLARAIERGGSTLRDFASADGQAGHFQLDAAVYGRADQPCRRCGAPIRLMHQGQRATYFCARCQRR
ncbi:MAG: bifunctional DNA-formamidopyrimidine glycosylase/DNA-(apurinic or apyrimidinic site) lyase [Burkholderiaceae bacterium]|jgi:formamidopyrimidine-DNA glycosylase|nr:bifunctional DNA-formamidopyrimidine glycosylase/DNA-(apurinic or apyrimidinic site) lyase [Burkholderiaceae bacterium]